MLGRYRKNNVTYLVNTGDGCANPCDAGGQSVAPLDTRPAHVQGPKGASYRMQRGLVFFNYLWNLGDHAPANHRLYILDGVQASCGHDAACMYGSALGQQVLLGQTVSAAPFDPATTVIPDLDAACRVCP